MQSHKSVIKAGIFSLLLIGLVLGRSNPAQAASAKFVPKLFVGYNYNDNVWGTDPEFVDPITMQWIDYLVGLDANYKSQYYSFTLGGSAGYSQYIDASTSLKDVLDINLARFNYYNLALNSGFQYLRPNFTFDLADEIKRSRKISDIFQTQISELSDIYLYTDNVASAQVRFRVNQPLSFLFRYEYETIIFETPESDLVPTNANVTRNSGFAKIAYQFNPKAILTLDLQGGQWRYGDVIYKDPSGDDIRLAVADFNYYQALLGILYKITPRTSIQVSGGAEQREYFGEPEGRDLRDSLLPIGRISFTSEQAYHHRLFAGAEYAQSMYGQNLFFTYWQGNAAFTYYFGKTLYATVTGIYKQDTFSRKALDLENIWKDDRQDTIYIGKAELCWDALKKYDTPYLSFVLDYQYDFRDSNIDGQVSDYVDNYPGVIYSYATEINTVLLQVRFSPTILIGSSK